MENILGRRIQELREASSLSQTQLAKAVNSTSGAISNYERGIRKPKYELLESLANYFCVDIQYLLGITDKPNDVNTNDPSISRYAKLIESRPELKRLISIAENMSEEEVDRLTKIAIVLK